MVGDPTSVENIEEITYIYTMPPYPNPTVSEVTAKFYWDSSIDIDNSEIAVYDITGNRVATLVHGYQNAGEYNVEFLADKLSTGVYFYRLQAGNWIDTKKMLIIK